MKHLMRLFRQTQAGFTMIELLVVIAILGILAIAVLSAINPIEQINRGRDTGSQSDAEQLLSAIDRFHAFQGYYPWVSNPTDDDDIAVLTNVDDNWMVENSGGPIANCTVLLRLTEGNTNGNCNGSDELKSTFANRITASDYNPLFVYHRGTANGDSTYVCFEPQSGAFETSARTRCNEGLPTDIDTSVADAAICNTSDAATRTIGTTTGVEAPLVCLP